MTTATQQLITVGLGEIRTATAADSVLMALGLGSCVALAMVDPRERVGGMAHIVLPEPLDASGAASTKFATVAVPALIEQVLALGAQRARLVCAIAGGAHVLNNGPRPHNARIGERNEEAVLAALKALGMRPRAADCGGTTGRSVRLVIQDATIAVKRLGGDWQEM
jgi:chemotaxis protein CheD